MWRIRNLLICVLFQISIRFKYYASFKTDFILFYVRPFRTVISVILIYFGRVYVDFFHSFSQIYNLFLFNTHTHTHTHQRTFFSLSFSHFSRRQKVFFNLRKFLHFLSALTSLIYESRVTTGRIKMKKKVL